MDAALLHRARSGDREAGDRFVAAHFDRVWRYARALTHDPVAAEDVVQDTFLAAFRGTEDLRGADATAWLLRIARHAWHRQHRRRVGEPSHFEGLDALGQSAGWGADPERAAVAAEDHTRFQAALARLDPEDREVLWLRDGEGRSGVEVAELVGLPLPAMKSRLHRARLRLMAVLREENDDG